MNRWVSAVSSYIIRRQRQETLSLPPRRRPTVSQNGHVLHTPIYIYTRLWGCSGPLLVPSAPPSWLPIIPPDLWRPSSAGSIWVYLKALTVLTEQIPPWRRPYNVSLVALLLFACKPFLFMLPFFAFVPFQMESNNTRVQWGKATKEEGPRDIYTLEDRITFHIPHSRFPCRGVGFRVNGGSPKGADCAAEGRRPSLI